MIRSVEFHNFKSLVRFSLPPKGPENVAAHGLPNFVCLVGMNGAGKSTLLQAFDFLRAVMSGSIRQWLQRREWKIKDIKYRNSFLASKVVQFKLVIEHNGHSILWEANFSAVKMKCVFERVSVGNVPLLEVKDAKCKLFFLKDSTYESITYNYEGSILSQMKESQYSDSQEIVALINAVNGIKSLDLLSPHQIRKAARDGEIGLGGERLAPTLYKFSLDRKEELQGIIREFYPSLLNYWVQSKKYGWKKIHFRENLGETDGILEVDEMHINDGLLRLLAIIALTISDCSVLLFDEIENGINPELVSRLMEYLVKQTNAQVFITTHSPMILNYLPDDIARESVFLLYRANGATQSTRYFDYQKTNAKLDFLGPGEVYADTPISELLASDQQGGEPK
ncbi:ATP-binding protein [Desulfovibrio aminophilus]|nr:ATP-binding protein [Desulfovibrio aminophilus]MCM0754395.1 ATP-binding protein [Desulfovibrio aminophilus]